MGMTTTMLAEDLKKHHIQKFSNRDEVVKLFQSRIHNILEHIKYDINSMRENALVSLSDIKDLYMITDMFGMQLDELTGILGAESYQDHSGGKIR